MDEPIRYVGARRGVFGLQSWAPAREPGRPSTAASVNFGSQASRQSVNAQRSPSVHCEQPPLQQQNHSAPAQLPELYNTEHVANSSGGGSEKNSNVAKPCKFVFCLTSCLGVSNSVLALL